MRRFIKYFFILLALLLLVLFAFVATFDANNYKPQIIQQVEKTTGRTFTIDGDIHLSIFPWIGLKVADVALGNEKGFKAKNFASIKQLDVKINVLPLLKKELEINTIRLHGLDVSLEVKKDKSNNWSSLTQLGAAGGVVSEKQKTGEVTEVQAQPSAEKTSPLQALKIEGFEFIDAVIRYDDRSRNTVATISELNLTTSAISFDEPIDVQFGARIENNQPVIDTRLNLSTQLRFNQALTVFNLNDFVFSVLMKANDFIPQQEKIEVKTNIDVSMDEQRIVIKQLQLSALDTTTTTDIIVSQFLTTPLIQGSIEVQAFNARTLAKRIGVELPAMAKADALHKVALKTSIKIQGDKLEANDFSVSLDESTLSGWLHVLNIGKQQLRYDLVFDQLNINDYLPPVVEAAPVETNAAAITTTGDEKIELPLEMLRQLDIQGDFRITALTVKEYKIKQLLMSLAAREGEISLDPLSMQLFDGQIEAVARLNVKKEIPAYALDLNVNQLQAGSVANPFLASVMGDKPIKMDGRVNVKMDIKTSGDSVNQLKQASKGTIVLDMKETRVEGFDPEFYMRSVIADFVHSKGFALSETIMGKYEPREITVFDKIHATIKLEDGKAHTDDFLMDSKRVKVTAKGHANIMENTMDIISSVQLPRAKTSVEKIFDEPLSVRIHGPFTALQFELDKDKLKKSTTDVLKKEAQAKLDAEKQRLEDKVRAEQKRAEEKIEEELNRATDKLEETLKDKLQSIF